MTKYLVTASIQATMEIEVKAENEEQAKEIAMQLQGYHLAGQEVISEYWINGEEQVVIKPQKVAYKMYKRYIDIKEVETL